MPFSVTDSTRFCSGWTIANTSFLNARIATVLADTLPDVSGFEFITPYTLRRVTGTPMDEMVNQTSVLQHHLSLKNIDNLWDLAARFNGQMCAELERCPQDNPNGLLPYVTDHIEFYRKKFGRPREKSWEISNLGVLKEETPPGWKLEGIAFTQGAGPLGPAFSVNCVTAGEMLTMAITWQESAIDEKLIVDALCRSLADLQEPQKLSSAV